MSDRPDELAAKLSSLSLIFTEASHGLRALGQQMGRTQSAMHLFGMARGPSSTVGVNSPSFRTQSAEERAEIRHQRERNLTSPVPAEETR